MYDINTVNLAKSLIPFVGWFPDTQINNTSSNVEIFSMLQNWDWEFIYQTIYLP